MPAARFGPSRCTLLTGLHTGHALIRGNTKVSLRPQDTTVEELLHAAGYQTAAFGKWGVGEPGSEGTPAKKGFDSFYGFIDQTHAHNSYPSFLFQNDTRIDLPNIVPNPGPYGQGVATTKAAFAPDLFEKQAATWLESIDPRRPFFLYFPTTIPHANNEAHALETPDLAPYADKPWPDAQKRYAALVTRLDTQVGQLLQALRDRHLDQNTLVIFASDNGPHEEGADPAQFFHSAGPFRGIKRPLYEGGIRVPLIAAWPGHIAPNTTSDLPIAFWDFLPTAAELARIPPADLPKNLDGLSFAPTLLGNPHAQKRHDYLYWEYYETGFQQALLLPIPGSRSTPQMPVGLWKAVRPSRSGPVELYDLQSDPAESQNLAPSNPAILQRVSDTLSAAHTDSPDYPIR